MMRSGIPRPTKTQQARQDACRAAGCVACRINLTIGLQLTGMAIEIHHQVSAGRRIGQDETVALCHWHHQADQFPQGYHLSQYRDLVPLFGPSLKRSPAAFAGRYGVNALLLAFQNEVLVLVESGMDYSHPGIHEVA